jgi:hypothetical protein
VYVNVGAGLSLASSSTVAAVSPPFMAGDIYLFADVTELTLKPVPDSLRRAVAGGSS